MSSPASSKEVKAGAAFVELFVTDNKLSAGLRAASKRIAKWAKDTKKLLQGFGQSIMFKGGVIAGLGTGAFSGLFAMAKQFGDAGDAVDKMTHRTGMSAEALSELGYAAQLCGADIDVIEKSVHKLQKLMLEAEQGSQGAVDKLAALGLSYRQLARLSPDEQFEALIDRLGQMDEATRAAHAMEIFGKSAHQLMPMINEGAAGIAQMRAEARKLGVSMSGPEAKAAAEFNDAMTRVQYAIRGISQHIGAALAPELTEATKWFTKITATTVKWIDKNKQWIVLIAKGAAVVAGLGAAIVALGVVFWGLGTVAGVAMGTLAFALNLVAGLVAFLISPIGMLIGGIVLLLWNFGQIGNAIEWLKGCWASLFSTATKAWAGISDAIAAGRIDLAMKVAWTAIKLVWKDGINFLYKWWLWIQHGILTAWNGTVYLLSTGWNMFQRFSIDTFHGIQAAWTIFTKTIMDTWSACMRGFRNAWDDASTFVAKGLAGIYAKLQGLDAAEMIRIVEEDHVLRDKLRNTGYDSEQKKRNDQFDKDMAAIGQNNLDAHAGIDAQQKTTDAAYEAKQNARQKAYDKELAQMEADRLEAEKEFNDAIAEAAKARAEFEAEPKVAWDKKAQDFGFDSLEDVIENAIEKAEQTIQTSSSGTFNAAAVQSFQRMGQALDKIVDNTSDTAKYVRKYYNKPQQVIF